MQNRSKTNFQNHYLIPLEEKAELIAESYKERQKSTQETLEELKKIIKEINSARPEHAKRELSTKVFSIFRILKKEDIDKPEEKVNQKRGFGKISSLAKKQIS